MKIIVLGNLIGLKRRFSKVDFIGLCLLENNDDLCSILNALVLFVAVNTNLNGLLYGKFTPQLHETFSIVGFWAVLICKFFEFGQLFFEL